MSSVRRSEAHQNLMELLVGLPAWEADRVRAAVAAFEAAIMAEGHEEQRDSDRVVTQLSLREARVRAVASKWWWLALDDDRERKISPEQLAAVGEFLLTVLDYPKLMDALEPEVVPCPVGKEDS